jgi:hypothetical protein
VLRAANIAVIIDMSRFTDSRMRSRPKRWIEVLKVAAIAAPSSRQSSLQTG